MIGIANKIDISIKGQIAGSGSPPPPVTFYLLAQNGDFLLAQNSDNLITQNG